MTDPRTDMPAATAPAAAAPVPGPGVVEATNGGRPPRSQWMDVWAQFRSHRGALVGATVFALILAFVYLGPFLYWHDAKVVPTGRAFIEARDTRPIYTALWDGAAKVNWSHPLGTDQLGRDQLARLMFGGQVSIAVGLAAMLLSLFLGTLVGVLAGYVRGLDGS
jgi:peptide/nickel transport system permease protein